MDDVYYWTTQEATDLINTYKKYEVLYKKSHKNYVCAVTRKEAFLNIVQDMQTHKPGVPEYAIRKKLKRLLNQLRTELKRRSEFIKNGLMDEYKPKLWCFKLFDFLIKEREENKNVEERQIEGSLDCNDISGSDGSPTEQKELKQEESSCSIDLTTDNEEDNVEEFIAISPVPSKESSEEIKPPSPKRFKSVPIERATNLNIRGDEFHYFALNVASQLRDMPMQHALEMEEHITSLLVRKRLENL